MASEEFDIVVVGGGVVGCGCALDAATRGLSVALVEQRDYASGTSSRSSKLIHGGLRYLEQRDFGLVREALRERSLLLKLLCPHLVTLSRFCSHSPVTRNGRTSVPECCCMTRWAAQERCPGIAIFSHRQALQLAPALRPDALVGAIQYYDAQVDDARHTVTLARTAALYGAVLASSARVVGFLREGERRRRCTGARPGVGR